MHRFGDAAPTGVRRDAAESSPTGCSSSASALAAWVMKDRPEWDREHILEAMAGAQPLRVKLPRPIQVILFYTTAAVSPEDGTVRFADDIYRHDARLDRALAARRSIQ